MLTVPPLLGTIVKTLLAVIVLGFIYPTVAVTIFRLIQTVHTP
jgi:hypothetical protein